MNRPQPAILQKIVGLPVVHTEHLVMVNGVFQWTEDESQTAFVFPDFLLDPRCEDGAQCTRHAECVAKVLGGHPMRLSVPTIAEPEELHHNAAARAPSRPAKTIADRVRINREARRKWDHNPTPEEVYEEMRRRGLE